MNIEKDFKNKLTKKDYMTYLINRNVVLLLSPIIIIALLISTIYAVINDGFTFSVLIYLLPVVLFILSYIQMFRVINHTLKSQQQIKELKITLTDNEYKDLTNGETNILPYEKAYCYKENKNYLYVFVDKYNALILPKREFETDELEKIKSALDKKMRKESLYPLSSWLMVVVLITLVVLIIYNMTI